MVHKILLLILCFLLLYGDGLDLLDIGHSLRPSPPHKIKGDEGEDDSDSSHEWVDAMTWNSELKKFVPDMAWVPKLKKGESDEQHEGSTAVSPEGYKGDEEEDKLKTENSLGGKLWW